MRNFSLTPIFWMSTMSKLSMLGAMILLFVLLDTTKASFATMAETNLMAYDFNDYILFGTKNDSGNWVACFYSPNNNIYYGGVNDTVGKLPNSVVIIHIDEIQIVVSQLFRINGTKWQERVFFWPIANSEYSKKCWKGS